MVLSSQHKGAGILGLGEIFPGECNQWCSVTERAGGAMAGGAGGAMALEA